MYSQEAKTDRYWVRAFEFQSDLDIPTLSRGSRTSHSASASVGTSSATHSRSLGRAFVVVCQSRSYAMLWLTSAPRERELFSGRTRASKLDVAGLAPVSRAIQLFVVCLARTHALLPVTAGLLKIRDDWLQSRYAGCLPIASLKVPPNSRNSARRDGFLMQADAPYRETSCLSL